jgi:hypothetical protein
LLLSTFLSLSLNSKQPKSDCALRSTDEAAFRSFLFFLYFPRVSVYSEK